MTKRALVKQAELKRMAAIAKSEGVVVSVEVDGRRFSVSPFLPTVTSSAFPRVPNAQEGWGEQQKDRFGDGSDYGDDWPMSYSSMPKNHRKKPIDVDAEMAKWHARLGYDPKTMNDDDYQRLHKELEEKWKKEIPTLPMTKLEKSALKQLLSYGAGVVVDTNLIKPCGIDTAERLEARGFIEFRMRERFPDRIEAYVLTEAGHAAAVKLSDQS